MDSDLIARAVKAGLVLGRCPGEHFQNGLGEWCCDRYNSDDGYLPCTRCDGTGEDRTPWAVFGAIFASGLLVELHQRTVGVGGGPLHVHDGTPEDIARVAVEAFCRAMEVSQP